MMTESADGFLFGISFGAGTAVRELTGFADAAQPSPGERLRWLHLDWRGAGTRHWFTEQAGVDPVAAEAALDDTVRPRVTHFGEAMLVVLRAANLEHGEEREDLVSLRLLAMPGCLVTLRRTRVHSAQDVRVRANEHPAGFRDVADLLVALTARVQDRLQSLIEDLGDELDDFEDRIAAPDDNPERYDIADLRRGTIALRKSLLPQRDALARLASETHPLLGKKHEKMIREEAQRGARLLDDVESMRERTVVLMEELAVESTERLNRRIYFFTVIAAIFLPLTFIAGALGMNVGGIPFSDHPSGFYAVMGVLGLSGVGIWLWLRRHQWV